MKKVIMLLLFLLVVTGCESSYNLEIYNGKFFEKTFVIEKDKNKWDTQDGNGVSYRQLINEEYNRDNFYYQKELINNEKELSLSYSNDFTLEEFDATSIIHRCYEYVKVFEEGEYIVLSTSLNNKCFEQYTLLDSLTINIKTNHKVESENADKSSHHTYTWVVNKNNYKEKSIQLKIYKNEYVWNYNNEVLKRLVLIILVIGGTVIIATIVYKLYQEKEKENF